MLDIVHAIPRGSRGFADDIGLPAWDAAIEKGARAMPALGPAAQLRTMQRLAEAGAWTDAALLLVELKAPEWRLRRLELDDGEWFCALSRSVLLPLEFDDVAEGCHRLAPIAILNALDEAVARRPAPVRDDFPLAPVGRPQAVVACGENFR